MPVSSNSEPGWTGKNTGPPTPNSSDLKILAIGGTTSALSYRPEEIQAMKSPVSTTERIEELLRDNGRLRQELASCQEIKQILEDLISSADSLRKEFETTMRTCNERLQVVERDRVAFAREIAYLSSMTENARSARLPQTRYGD